MDKKLHSAVGFGSISTALISLFFVFIGSENYIIFIPIILAVGKEILDWLSYGKFDFNDIKATLWPEYVWRMIYSRIKEVFARINK